MEEKIVVIRLDLDVDKYTKEAVELNKKISDLNKQQKDLKKAGQETSLAYQQNKEKLAIYSKELASTNKIILDTNRANKAAAGSNEEMRAQLSVLTAQYNAMSKEERESTNTGKEKAEQVAFLTDTLKKNESAVGDNRRNVGNYASALADLKEELKNAKGEAIAMGIQFGTDSKQFQEATDKAGKLKDELDDVNEAIKASATGSGFEKLKNQLSGVFSSAMSGDLKEAQEKAKGLAATAKTISFKESLASGKAFIVTLGEMAVAMFALPIFWLIAGLAAIAAAVYFWQKAQQENTQTQLDNFDKILTWQNRIYDGQIKLASAAGKKTEEIELKKLEFQRKVNDIQIMLLKRQANTLAGLNDDQKKQLEDLLGKQSETIYAISAIKVAEYKKQSDEYKKQTEKDIETIKKFDEKHKERLDKQREEYQQFLKDRADANKEMLRKIEDQEIELIKDQSLREFAKAALDNQRREQEIKDSKASADVKAAALVEQEKVFQQQLTDINKAESDKRKAEDAKEAKAYSDALAKKAENTMAFENIEKASLDKTANNRALAESLRVEAAGKSLQLTITILNQELELKQRAIDQEIAAIQAKQAAGETLSQAELLQIKNLNDQKLLLDQDYNAKKLASETETAEALKAIHKQAIEEKYKDAETGIEIAKISLSGLNDLLYIFGANQDELAGAAKALALFQIGLETAKAITGVVSMSTQGDPYTYALRVATGIVTVVTNVAKAKELVTGKPRPANIQQFATGGTVLSGERIQASHGQSQFFSNGDNMLATVRAGEVVLNERQQALLGGAPTFRQIGVPGFADGGIAGDFVSTNVESQMSISRQVMLAMQNLPPIFTVVEDIVNAGNIRSKIISKSEV